MSLKKTITSAQWVLSAYFAWDKADTMVNSLGNTVDMGLTNAGGAGVFTNGIFKVIKLPKGAIVVGGAVQTTETFDTAGYDVKVGIEGTLDKYLASTDIKTAGAETPLVPVGTVTDGEDIYLSFSSDDACASTGKAILRVDYIIDGRANENTPN